MQRYEVLKMEYDTRNKNNCKEIEDISKIASRKTKSCEQQSALASNSIKVLKNSSSKIIISVSVELLLLLFFYFYLQNLKLANLRFYL